MNLTTKHSHTGGWIAAVLSALGAAVFLLWQPVTDYFVTGTYDDNIVLQIDPDTLKTTDGKTLLSVRVRVANRGNVPFKLTASSKGDLKVEVRQISKVVEGEWIELSQHSVVARKIVLNSDSGDISVPPSSYWAKEFAVALPKGVYGVEALLSKQDGGKLTEEIIYELGK